MKPEQKNRTIFISYRRDGGGDAARQIHDALTAKGYRVFLDLKTMGSGPFDETLYREIEASTDFLLILPPNGLDRCVNEDDWVRQEIEHAEKCGKNIIPVRLRGFSFPNDMPEGIRFVSRLNGPTQPSMEYDNAFIGRIEQFLKSPRPRSPLPWRLSAAIAALVLVLTAAGLHSYFSVYPRTQTQQNLVSSLISYMVQNLKKADLSMGLFEDELDSASQYVDNKSNKREADVSNSMAYAVREIQEYAESVTTMTDAQREQWMSSPFDVGDLEVFRPVLIEFITGYVDDLNFIRAYILPDNGLSVALKSGYIAFRRQLVELDAEMLFYQMNETLLPVTNEEALSDLKSLYLPEMTALFSTRLNFSRDLKTIQGKENAIFQQYKKLYDQYESLLEQENTYAREHYLAEAVTALAAAGEQLGRDMSGLLESLERIEAKSQSLEALKQELSEANTKLAELKKEAAEKFKPSEDDEIPTLWGKGTRFLTIHMPLEAEECFTLCTKKEDDLYYAAAVSAVKFCQNYSALNLEGGIVVAQYEENLPHQAVEIGDILYAVEGEPVRNYAEYTAAVSGVEIYRVSILRFTPDGYDLLESTIDKSLGRIAVIGLIDEPVQ